MNIDKFLNENQDPDAVSKLCKKLQDLMTTSEEIDYIAVQKKPAVTINPDCIAVTNKRVIFCFQKNLGFTFDFKDVFWNALSKHTIKENLLGAVVAVKTIDGDELSMDYLPKSQGRKIYAAMQQYLENNTSSNFVVNTVTPTLDSSQEKSIDLVVSQELNDSPIQDNSSDKMIADLLKLKSLFEAGAISLQDYESKKQEILKSL